MGLVPVSPREVTLGVPLASPVFSATGKLLLGKGHVVWTSSQLGRLFEVGAFRAALSHDRLLDNNEQRALSVFTGDDRPAEESATSGTDFPAIWTQPEAFLITLPGNRAVASVQYVGMLKDQSLLVRLHEGIDTLQPDVEVDAKVLLGRSLHAFRTAVVVRATTPFDVIYLRYPKAVTKRIVRQHFRVALDAPARLLRNDTITAGFAATWSTSASTAQVSRSKRAPYKGASISGFPCGSASAANVTRRCSAECAPEEVEFGIDSAGLNFTCVACEEVNSLINFGASNDPLGTLLHMRPSR